MNRKCRYAPQLFSWDTASRGVCIALRNNELWNKLNGNSYYFEKEDGAYIYYNKGDQRWWIDAKSGLGVYIADTDGSEDAKKYPPQDGYKVLQNAKLPLPTVIVKTRNNNNKEGNEMLWKS